MKIVFVLTWALVYNGGVNQQTHREYFTSKLRCEKRLEKLYRGAKQLHTDLDYGQCMEAQLDITH